MTQDTRVGLQLPGPDLPYIVLDQRAFKKANVDEQAAEDTVSALLPKAVASLARSRQSRFLRSIVFLPRPR